MGIFILPYKYSTLLDGDRSIYIIEFRTYKPQVITLSFCYCMQNGWHVLFRTQQTNFKINANLNFKIRVVNYVKIRSISSVALCYCVLVVLNDPFLLLNAFHGTNVTNGVADNLAQPW